MRVSNSETAGGIEVAASSSSAPAAARAQSSAARKIQLPLPLAHGSSPVTSRNIQVTELLLLRYIHKIITCYLSYLSLFTLKPELSCKKKLLCFSF